MADVRLVLHNYQDSTNASTQPPLKSDAGLAEVIGIEVCKIWSEQLDMIWSEQEDEQIDKYGGRQYSKQYAPMPLYNKKIILPDNCLVLYSSVFYVCKVASWMNFIVCCSSYRTELFKLYVGRT
jgi:hypothetical protein